MARTAWRPTAKGELTNVQTLAFSVVLCVLGAAILLTWVNALTLWLTLATFVGYAIVYTLILKPLTPQNIVWIGGASGAMPPVLGWPAMRARRVPDAVAAVPDHLPVDAAAPWALGPVSHRGLSQGGPADAAGHARARLHQAARLPLRRLLLFAGTLLPFVSDLSGWFYLVCASNT